MNVNTPDLEALLTELRRVKGDHQWVEAKKSELNLPSELWKTLSAFANTRGGVLLLGVEELAGKFEVTGIRNSADLTNKLESLCSEAIPPIHPIITPMAYDGKNLLHVEVPGLRPGMGPCYFPSFGTIDQSAYRRIGDGDVKMGQIEIDENRYAHSPIDFSKLAPMEGAKLSSHLVDIAFREKDELRVEAMRDVAAINDDGSITLAGWLTLGDKPQTTSALAKVGCIRQPHSSDPNGTVQQVEQVRGTIGELLEGVINWLQKSLSVTQVKVGGHISNETDYPLLALREVISNALVHRSLSPSMAGKSISVNVYESMIVVTSPGSITPGVDPRKLGLERVIAPKNYALATLCDSRIKTPSGWKVFEFSTSGIRRSDELCHEVGVAPLIFNISPTDFSTIAIRGKVPLEEVSSRWPDIELGSDKQRILATLIQLEKIQTQDEFSTIRGAVLDAPLAARILAPSIPEKAVKVLTELVSAHILVEETQFDRLVWSLPTSPVVSLQATRRRRANPKRNENIERVLLAIDAAPGKELRRADAQIDLQARATQYAFSAAREEGLIEPDETLAHDPARKYTLTHEGRSAVTKLKQTAK